MMAHRPPTIPPPPHPSRRQELLGDFLLRALSPRLKRVEPCEPPSGLAPFTCLEIERPGDRGRLSVTWYPTDADEPRGGVLLVHPWVPWGQAYFHRRGRIPALRAAGYHVLTFDLGGVGRSDPSPMDFHAADLEAALGALEDLAGGIPHHLWGVSAGGYWSHLVLSRRSGIRGAFFEDVAAHLIRWSWRMAPWGFPCYLFFQYGLPGAFRFLDLRRHAPRLRVGASAYVSGEKDRGVPADETRELARLAQAECLIVPGAEHLGAIKGAEAEVIALALKTFELAEGSAAAMAGEPALEGELVLEGGKDRRG